MISKKNWWLLFILSLGVIIPFMVPYLTINPDKSRIQISSTMIQFPALIAHIVFAFIALILGFLQFLERIRIMKPHIHRYLGQLYVVSVFVSGLLAIIVIFYVDNFSKAISFLVLTIVWLITTWMGYKTVKQKNYFEHRKWMIRSFGITLVAVSGRVIVPILILIYLLLNGFSLPGVREKMVEEVLNVNIWIGLILNFIIIESILLKPKKV